MDRAPQNIQGTQMGTTSRTRYVGRAYNVFITRLVNFQEVGNPSPMTIGPADVPGA